MAGYAMLNCDGSVRWRFKSRTVDQEKGHVDCCRVLRRGKTTEDYRLVLTCCSADNIACVDGNGKIFWELSGHHFQSVQTGSIIPGLPQPQMIVDIDHRPFGESPLWILDANGKQLGQITSDYCRVHALLDWNGDGFEEVLLVHAHGVFDHRGKRIATFETGGPGIILLLGDMTGDGIPDVTITTADPLTVYIFKNANDSKSRKAAALGCGVNFTLY
jgi:hypothetical protein